jgi:prolyl-tRNA synthetase
MLGCAGRVQGVPLRVEVGPRDVAQRTCVVARRDQPTKDGKAFGVPMEPDGFVTAIQGSVDLLHP